MMQKLLRDLWSVQYRLCCPNFFFFFFHFLKKMIKGCVVSSMAKKIIHFIFHFSTFQNLCFCTFTWVKELNPYSYSEHYLSFDTSICILTLVQNVNYLATSAEPVVAQHRRQRCLRFTPSCTEFKFSECVKKNTFAVDADGFRGSLGVLSIFYFLTSTPSVAAHRPESSALCKRPLEVAS